MAAAGMSATALREKAEAIAGDLEPVTVGQLDRLRAPFPAEQVGQLPKAGITLDYVGHGAVTHRLLEVDPSWSWEPFATDEHGLPAFTTDRNGNPVAFWIRLTVCGVTRPGVGTCNANQFDAEKVLIGDALRNAAMRFGVALDLWIRGHAEDDEKVSSTGTGLVPDRSTTVRAIAAQHAKNQILELLGGDKDAAGKVWEEAGLKGERYIPQTRLDELIASVAPFEGES